MAKLILDVYGKDVEIASFEGSVASNMSRAFEFLNQKRLDRLMKIVEGNTGAPSVIVELAKKNLASTDAIWFDVYFDTDGAALIWDANSDGEDIYRLVEDN